MKKSQFRLLIGLSIAVPAMLAYQNCANNYKITASGQMAAGNDATATGNPTTGNNTGSTQAALTSTRPVFAVRGINCVACHGIVGSNIVTDFGYGTANFQPANSFFTGTRTAFDNVDVGNGAGGWQSLTVAGSIIVPQVTIPASQANGMFGVNQALSLVDVLGLANPVQKSGSTMLSGVTPTAGVNSVQTKATVTISYPSETEILGLMPVAQQSAKVAVSAINVSNLPATVMSGFVVDPSGNFVRNSSGTVMCTGDVVIKGPLLLKNLSLQTDSNGCRLYVSQTVFIQGPITYSGTTAPTLQISSARGIMMGLSSAQMGAVPGLTFSSLTPTTTIRTNQSVLKTPGGPWPRFAAGEELEYNPGGATINGVASSTYFDNLVIDSLAVGAELLDAGDPAAVNNLLTGETTVTEVATSANAGNGGVRVAINYAGLILNAPHVHSRYGGSLKGAIIADVAMLARNPSSSTLIEQFQYDTVIDGITVVLPALTTDILVVK